MAEGYELSVALPPELIDALADAVAARIKVESPEPVADRSRLTLTIPEASETLGMSADHFRRHVLPDLRVVRSGRLRLVPVSELEAWVDRSAARALG